MPLPLATLDGRRTHPVHDAHGGTTVVASLREQRLALQLDLLRVRRRVGRVAARVMQVMRDVRGTRGFPVTNNRPVHPILLVVGHPDRLIS